MDIVNPNHIYWDHYAKECFLPEYRGELVMAVYFEGKNEFNMNILKRPSENEPIEDKIGYAMFIEKTSGLIYNGINETAIKRISEIATSKLELKLSYEEIRLHIAKEISERLFGWKFEDKPTVI